MISTFGGYKHGVVMNIVSQRPNAPKLPPNLQPLLDADFPVFSGAEMARRRAALTEIMSKAGTAHVLLSGGDRKGSAMQWLTGWPPGGGHFCVVTPGEQDAIWVKNPNNAPLAKIFASAAKVSWGPEGSLALAIEELTRRGAKGKAVGIIGSYGHSLHEKLSEAGFKPTDLGRAYTRLRLVKSPEELDWLRIGCALTDMAVEALGRDTQPGMTEHELGDVIERAYVRWAGMTQIHYTGVTSMAAPDCCVPRQLPINRVVRQGDVMFTEISVSFWSYPGQVQRSFTDRRRSHAALSRPVSMRRGYVPRHSQGAQARRAARRHLRRRRGHRQGRLHHLRRSGAWLWRRRLSAAGARHARAPIRTGARFHLRRTHDRGDSAFRHHEGW